VPLQPKEQTNGNSRTDTSTVDTVFHPLRRDGSGATHCAPLSAASAGQCHRAGQYAAGQVAPLGRAVFALYMVYPSDQLKQITFAYVLLLSIAFAIYIPDTPAEATCAIRRRFRFCSALDFSIMCVMNVVAAQNLPFL